MRRTAVLWILLGLLLAQVFSVGTAGAREPGDVIFGAMRDELERNMAHLEITGSSPPYFLSYTTDDIQELRIKASLGSLTKSKLERSRFVTADLRVGDSDLDNANFAAGWSHPSPVYTRVATDNDYDALRNEIYLLTDKAYKQGLQTLAKKEAYLETRLIKDRPADLIEEVPHASIGRPEAFDIDEPYFDDLARAASGVLKGYPMIVSSELDLTVAVVNQYFLNSRGTSALRGNRIYSVKIAMSGRGPDGDDVLSDDEIIVNDLKDLPGAEGLSRWVATLADQLVAAMGGSTIEEYSGPVIFTDEAAGEFFQQILAKNISGLPAPLFEEEASEDYYPVPHLADRVGRRVLPEFMDVYDDPGLSRLGRLHLVGTYEVDDAGRRPERIQIVEGGKLVGLPIGTAPARKILKPNGHGRGAMGLTVLGRPANLVVESSEHGSFEDLRRSMLEICRDYDLEYGLVIRRLANLWAPYEDGVISLPDSPSEIYLSDPIVAYKVFPDGREEPVRNLEFGDLTLRVLRDIIETGKTRYVHNYFIMGDYEMPASIVCPAILIEEMELGSRDIKPRKPPVLASPLAGDD
jgi:TldD protein